MPFPIYTTREALADLAALDTATAAAVREFLRRLRDDPRPAGAVELGEGLFKMRDVAGCWVYWEDPAIRGKLTVSRVFRPPVPPRA